MSDSARVRVTVTQESDYAFRVAFDDTAIPGLLTDESAPLGGDRGPNPSRLLVAAVANCLSASLLFALRKFSNSPGTLVAHAEGEMVRNAHGRLRVGRIAVTLALPGAADDYHQLDHLLQQFEDFCVVTESVRAGVPVQVQVRDGGGALLHESAVAPA